MIDILIIKVKFLDFVSKVIVKSKLIIQILKTLIIMLVQLIYCSSFSIRYGNILSK